MGKRQFKPGNMLYPVPAVLVTAADREGNSNIFTVAWAGTICTNPPMLSISVRPERHSYHMMKETGEFVVNLTTESMAWATDYCGVRSGRDVDKWKETGLTPEKANVVTGDQREPGEHRVPRCEGGRAGKPSHVYRRCCGGGCG